jgi:hypothetical protein
MIQLGIQYKCTQHHICSYAKLTIHNSDLQNFELQYFGSINATKAVHDLTASPALTANMYASRTRLTTNNESKTPPSYGTPIAVDQSAPLEISLQSNQHLIPASWQTEARARWLVK